MKGWRWKTTVERCFYARRSATGGRKDARFLQEAAAEHLWQKCKRPLV